MKLYFLRHADALEGLDDTRRALSPKGKAQAHQIGRFLARAQINFDVAFSSPLIRARETAVIVLESSNDSNKLDLNVTEALLNETSQSAFEEWLDNLPGVKHLLLVGHAPSLGQRVCRFLGTENSENLMLPKAGLACVRTEDRRTGVLKFLVTPKSLGM